jgi:hypothetical protein
MKRHGPPSASGPGADKLKVARRRFHTRSDAGRASLTPRSSPSLSKPPAPATVLGGTATNVLLTARGRSRFDASFNGAQLVQASKNPISDDELGLIAAQFKPLRIRSTTKSDWSELENRIPCRECVARNRRHPFRPIENALKYLATHATQQLLLHGRRL